MVAVSSEYHMLFAVWKLFQATCMDISDGEVEYRPVFAIMHI